MIFMDAGTLGSLEGWTGVGLLGTVLSWLLLKHLPEKDRQIKELLDTKDRQIAQHLEAAAQDRELDRARRHENVQNMQKAINQVVVSHASQMEELNRQHLLDAERDRAAFLDRQSRIEDALRVQTAELKAALASSCRFGHTDGPVPPSRGPRTREDSH